MKFFGIKLRHILHVRLEAGLSAYPGKARQNIGLDDRKIDRLESYKIVDVLYGSFSGHWNDPQLISVIEDASKITGDLQSGTVDVTGKHAHRSDRRRWRRSLCASRRPRGRAGP